MENNDKIYFIENEDLSRDSSGGIMTYINNLSNYLFDNGFVVFLFGCGHISPNYDSKIIFKSISSRKPFSNLYFFLKLFYSNLLGQIKNGAIIHIQRPEMAIPIKLRKTNKIVCTLHGGQDIATKEKRSLIFSSFYRIIFILGIYMADHLIAVDNFNYQRYLKKYPFVKKKISLIPIGINTTVFMPKSKCLLRKKYNFDTEEKIILFVGRLEYEKNVDFLIDCFNSIPNKEEYTLFIVGEGTLKASLESMASHETKIKFLGEIPQAEMVDIYNLSDVLVLLSKFEGSPTVVREAVACNTPVISTDVGDVREFLQSMMGGEIIGPNFLSFYTALKKIISNTSHYINRSGSQYDYKMMGSKTMQVYQKINMEM